MIKELFDLKGTRVLLVFVLTALLLWLVYTLRSILYLILFSCFLAYLLDPLVRRLERFRIGRTMAIVLAGFLVGIVFFALARVLSPVLQAELGRAAQRFPQHLQTFQQQVAPWLRQMARIELPEDLPGLVQQLLTQAGGLSPLLGERLKDFLSATFSSLLGFILGLLHLLLVPVFVFYLLRDFEPVKMKVLSSLPREREKAILRMVGGIDGVLKGFLRGQLLVCLCVGTLIAFGLYFVGLDLAVFVGIFSGFANFIPYFGPLVSVTLAVILALLQFGDLKHPLGVAAIFFAVKALDDVFITPRLVGRRVGLHPMLVILAVMVGGKLGGFMGLLLAVPFAAVLKVLIRELFTSGQGWGVGGR